MWNNFRRKVVVIDRKQRYFSAVLDHMIMTLVVGVFAMPGIIYHMIYIDKLYLKTHQLTSQILSYTTLIGFALYYCKDCIRGQSLAKRLSKFRVINHKTGEIAGSFRCVVRNMFIILLPVEAIMIAINPTRRLGDYVAGTEIIKNDGISSTKKIDVFELIFSFLLAYVFVFILQAFFDR